MKEMTKQRWFETYPVKSIAREKRLSTEISLSGAGSQVGRGMSQETKKVSLGDSLEERKEQKKRRQEDWEQNLKVAEGDLTAVSGFLLFSSLFFHLNLDFVLRNNSYS